MEIISNCEATTTTININNITTNNISPTNITTVNSNFTTNNFFSKVLTDPPVFPSMSDLPLNLSSKSPLSEKPLDQNENLIGRESTIEEQQKQEEIEKQQQINNEVQISRIRKLTFEALKVIGSVKSKDDMIKKARSNLSELIKKPVPYVLKVPKTDKLGINKENEPLGVQSKDRYKTELCRKFMENSSCPYGRKCQFAHGYHELRPVARHPRYRTELCREYFNHGLCTYGTRCNFIHQLPEEVEEEEEEGGTLGGFKEKEQEKKTDETKTLASIENNQSLNKRIREVTVKLANNKTSVIILKPQNQILPSSSSSSISFSSSFSSSLPGSFSNPSNLPLSTFPSTSLSTISSLKPSSIEEKFFKLDPTVERPFTPTNDSGLSLSLTSPLVASGFSPYESTRLSERSESPSELVIIQEVVEMIKDSLE